MSDLISRQAAIEAIERLILPQGKGETAAEEINRVAWRCAINCAEEMIGHLPTAERAGKWIATKEWGGRNFSCSECRFEFTVDTCMLKPIWNYCPNCGARMRGDEDEQRRSD